ncbi:MAG: DUF4097 family beta strand repeat-containing protein [Myxococcota bacterium]
MSIGLAGRAGAAEDPCRDSGQHPKGWSCAVRDATVAPTGALRVETTNGGISVVGWDRDEVSVRAVIQANASTNADADAIVSRVALAVDPGRLGATGPTLRRDETWVVSWEIHAPAGTDLTLTSTNGGLSVTSIAASIDLRTTNGGISLTDVNGRVTGTTTNGGLDVVLDGPGWQGAGLDLRTTNGPIALAVPRSYAADLDATTEQGRIRLGMPVSTTRMPIRLAGGGAPIHLETRNGAISLEAR